MNPEARGEYSETEEFQRRISTAIGILLIAIGVCMALWVFSSAYRMFTNPQNLEVFGRIVPRDSELRKMVLNGDEVILPVGLFDFMAYAAGAVLLFIAGMVGGAFLTAGVNLLSPGGVRLAGRVRRELLSLRSSMDELSARLNREKSGP